MIHLNVTVSLRSIIPIDLPYLEKIWVTNYPEREKNDFSSTLTKI